MDREFIFFDLDGTLTDPVVGITKAVQYSLKAFGIVVDDPSGLTAFIGPPLKESIMRFYRFSEEEAEKAVLEYRVYYSERGIFENTVYGGIEPMLKKLTADGGTLVLATSKPTVYAERILLHFELDKYFAFISGSELDGRRTSKDAVVRYALDNMNVSDVRKCVMVGDREYDIFGAKKNGMESVGVLYGYGSREELENAGAEYIVENVDGLSALLSGFVRNPHFAEVLL